MQGPQQSTDTRASRMDRVIGSILGGAIGDWPGGPDEGKPAPTNLDRSARWDISDDTILNIATCEAIIDHGAPDPAAIAQKLGALYCTGALTGAGASTVKAAQELSHGGHWALVGRKGA